MARIPRKSDGRRIYSAQFKNEQIGKVLRGETSIADLSRKLGIARSLLQRWKRLIPQGAAAPGAADMGLNPGHKLGTAQYVRELQVLIGKQTLELELLRAEVDALKRGRAARGSPRR